MRAAVWHGPRDVRVEDWPEPESIPSGGAVVAVDLAFICASDVAEYKNGPHVIPVGKVHPLTLQQAPIVLGHEYVGRVVAVADDVVDLRVGDRVCGDSCIRCGTCFWCLRGEYNICEKGASVGLHSHGAFASEMSVPAYALVKVPDEVPDREAALVEPLAVGLHALRRGRVEPGDRVVVVGYGMIGAAVMAVALAIGVSEVYVIETTPDRLKLAEAAGATAAIHPDDARREVRRLTGIGADVVVDCTGRAEVLASAVELSRRGGRIVITGIPHSKTEISAERVVYFEREILGSLGYRFDHERVLRLFQSGQLVLPPVAGDPIGLEDIVDLGLARAAEDPGAPLRIPVELG